MSDIQLRLPKVLHGQICLPASKSISNRMLLISQLAKGQITLHNISDCDDTRAMRGSIRTPSFVDIGAAGTAMRFLTAYYASTPSEVVITGTERMRHRPIGVLVDTLRSLGADIDYEGEQGFPPLRIRGKQLEGGSVTMAGSVSSQYVSALLMVAPTMSQGLTLTLEGEIISRPYIDMTTSLMRRFGITVEEPDERTFRVLPGEYTEGEYLIENDWSAASYWYEMLALADDGEIELQGLFADSLQGDSCVQQLFEPLGVETTFNEKGVVIRKQTPSPNPFPLMGRGVSPIRGGRKGGLYVADLAHCPDLAQTMVATCCGMGVPFRFTGLQTLRIKETDRLLALQQELAKLGYEVRVQTPSPLPLNGECGHQCLTEELVYTPERQGSGSACIDTYSDHRMAMCMAPLAMIHEGLVIKDAEVVSKSYPTFWSDMEKFESTRVQEV